MTRTQIQALKAENAELKRKLAEQHMLDLGPLLKARDALLKADKQFLMASAVMVHISALGGREIASFGIIDGLRPETIQALREDIEITIADRIKVLPAAGKAILKDISNAINAPGKA